MRKANPKQGFTLLEMMVSMALGLIVMAAMASLFKIGMNSMLMATQRTETQANMRAAIDIMAKDLSLAGEGLPTGGIQLPTGTGSTGSSRYGCDATTCHVPTTSYPTGNYMYGIIPGNANGVEGGVTIPAATSLRNDSITVIYADYNFPLWEYNLNFNFTGTPSGANVTVTANPSYVPAPPAITSAGGIQVGDLIMVQGAGLTAVGEVTGITSSSLAFANLDPLNMNQDGAQSGNLKAIATAVGTATPVNAYRLFAVTYYLTVPASGSGQTPRLMRQVNGLTPVPVADDIINLQLAYDVYNAGALDANQPNPLGVSESPNNIQKINLVVMGQSIINSGRNSQGMYLATSVSARNMTFRNRYQ